MSLAVFDPNNTSHFKYTGSASALRDLQRFSEFNSFAGIPLKAVRFRNVGCFILEADIPCIPTVDHAVIGMALNGQMFIPLED